MTLEQLRPILARYNVEGAVLRLLEMGGLWTPSLLAEYSGRGQRSVFKALAALRLAGLIERSTSGVYWLVGHQTEQQDMNNCSPLNNSSVKLTEPHSTSLNNCSPPPTEQLFTPEQQFSEVDSTIVNLTEQQDMNNCSASGTGQGETCAPNSENANGTENFSPFLLSTSLKEKDLKEKEVNSKSSKGGSGGKPKKSPGNGTGQVPKTGQQNLPKYEPRTDTCVPEWLPLDVWASFCDHRDALKRPLSSHAVKLLAQKLERSLQDFGLEATIEAISESIINGWQGVFPRARASPETRRRPARRRIVFTEEDANHDPFR